MSAFASLGSFASGLLSSIDKQVGLGENTPQNLDQIDPDDPNRIIDFGNLGDYRNKIDQSAQRNYVETGFIRNLKPKESEILMQEPDMTLIIKKRLFSSLSENFKPELMDSSEKLFYRAAKKIFQTKCEIISNYERLIKIERISNTMGVLNDALLPAIFSSIDTLDSLGGSSFIDGKTRSVFETIRKVKAFSDPLYQTTWLTDRELPALSDLGSGTGAFELTMLSNFDCTTSTQFNGGSANFSVEDPYRMMIVTTEDIDQAIRDTAGGFLNNSFFTLTKATLEETIDQLRAQLTKIRRARRVNDIKFIITETSILFKKMRAIFDEVGIEIIFNYDAGGLGFDGNVNLDDSATTGTNGLQDQEIDLFKQIIQNIYQFVALQQNTETNKFTFNRTTNHVRRKLMLHFGNKPMIQPMDVVHVFMGTKSLLDPKIATDITNSFNIGDVTKGINDSISSIQNTLDDLSGVQNSYAETEKNAIAGEEFPMWLWNLMRNDFTKQAAGTHVFAGLVQSVSHDYQNGKYTLNVNCTDNAGYFKNSRINIQPSVEVFNSALYDPLTPFDLDFDPSSGFLSGEFPTLLPENLLLLNTGLIKFKNGRFRGQPASQEIYQALDGEQVRNKFRRKLEDPDGFVYRWKEGIQSLTLLQEPHPSSSLRSEASPSMTANPYAGQDVMNVLSLLVTGQPYNFNSFMRAAINSGNISRDELTNETGVKSFYRGLLSEINKANATWGSFVPFKKLIVNEGAYTFLQSGEFDIISSNTSLSNLLRQRAQRFDELVKVVPQFANNPQYLNVSATGTLVNPNFQTLLSAGGFNSNIVDTATLSKLGQDIIKLDFQIQQIKTKFTQSVTNANINTNDGSIKIFGDDISFDPTVSQGENAVTTEEKIRERSDFRKRINSLTQRRLWRVKANEDTNLFIVDDSYDKNYDIQAFEKALAGEMGTFKNTYVDVASQIEIVYKTLGLEVFADSQGHIQARPPQYNRMPSSVFYNMLEKKDITGIQIFPTYLESLFVNMVKGLSDRIEILEDEIRIRAAVLGFITDAKASQKLSGKISPNSSASTTAFAFVTSEQTGLLGSKDLRILIDQANPDLTDDRISHGLQALNVQLRGFQTTTVNFDVVQRVALVNETSFGNGVSQDDINSKVFQIGVRLQQKTGQPAPTPSSLISATNLNDNRGRSQLDVLNVTEQISKFLSERQSVLKQLTNAVKNLNEGISLNSGKESGRTVLLPFLNKQKQFPEILEHMIEDEDYDDLGEKSGKRYIIKEHQIISLRIEERPPPFTTVEVTGLFGEGIAGEEGLATDGGNAISTAWAVDFDMWRMYGFRSSQTFPAPFLSNPDSQCAPYAVFQLNLARKNIFQGTVTIAGNEFIQPGEVYYLEDRDLLFYAESVSHHFQYGGSYTTTIELKYGRNPGEYIPTILDIIGKGLYTNKHQADLIRHNRHGQANGDVPIAVLVFDNQPISEGEISSDSLSNLVGGSYGDQNRKNLANILLALGGVLTPTQFGKVAKMEVRVYEDSLNNIKADTKLIDTANAIQSYIKNPTVALASKDGNLAPDPSVSGINTINLTNDNFSIEVVDLGEKTETRSPSSGAWNKAREISSTSGVPSIAEFQAEETLGSGAPELYANIIDVWVTFSDSETTSEVSGSVPSDQNAQEALQKTLNDFNSKIQSVK